MIASKQADSSDVTLHQMVIFFNLYERSKEKLSNISLSKNLGERRYSSSRQIEKICV